MLAAHRSPPPNGDAGPADRDRFSQTIFGPPVPDRVAVFPIRPSMRPRLWSAPGTASPSWRVRPFRRSGLSLSPTRSVGSASG
jgi:hypothetical protein